MNALSTPEEAGSPIPTLGRIFGLARGVFALIGFSMALVIAVPHTRDGLLNQFHAATWRPVVRVATAGGADVIETGGPAAPAHALKTVALEAGTGTDVTSLAARAALARYIANRYRVAEEMVTSIVNAAFGAAEAQAIDPLVILAVVATESSYNPIAESVVGAKGLMQVIAKFHPEKLADHGGEGALFQPEVNIQVGTQILREYLRRFGDLEIALQVYAGALDDTDARYARKVLAERSRLQQALERSRREA